MTETELTPAPASPHHQCYEQAFSLLSKLAAGAMVNADPEVVQAFLTEIERAHRILAAAQLDRWLPAQPTKVYPDL